MMGKVKIEVSQEVRNKIMKAFGVTSKSVSNALNYTGERGQTDLAKRIRRMAMNNGGRRMAYWPECETIHDEGTGEMVQTFRNGAKLVIRKDTGDAVVYYKGVARQRQENISIRQLYMLQEFAAAI